MSSHGRSYEKRLLIDLSGNDSTEFQSISGETIATGFARVVVGKRGPYVEFAPDQINKDVIFVPEEHKFRLTSGFVYYNEWRSRQDNVKLYEQKKVVAYADYRIGMWYVSPFDLRVDGEHIILPLQKQKRKDIFALERKC